MRLSTAPHTSAAVAALQCHDTQDGFLSTALLHPFKSYACVRDSTGSGTHIAPHLLLLLVVIIITSANRYSSSFITP